MCTQDFAENIDLKAGSNIKLQNLTNTLTDSSNAYGMDRNSDRTESNANGEIFVNGEQIEVKGFQHLGANLSKYGSCIGDIHIRITTATETMTRLERIW